MSDEIDIMTAGDKSEEIEEEENLLPFQQNAKEKVNELLEG